MLPYKVHKHNTRFFFFFLVQGRKFRKTRCLYVGYSAFIPYLTLRHKLKTKLSYYIIARIIPAPKPSAASSRFMSRARRVELLVCKVDDF